MLSRFHEPPKTPEPLTPSSDLEEATALHKLVKDTPSTKFEAVKSYFEELWKNRKQRKYSRRNSKFEKVPAIWAIVNYQDEEGRTPLHYIKEAAFLKKFVTEILTFHTFTEDECKMVRSNYIFGSGDCPCCGGSMKGGMYDDDDEDDEDTVYFGRPDQSVEGKTYGDICHLEKDDRCFLTCNDCGSTRSRYYGSSGCGISKMPAPWGNNVFDVPGRQGRPITLGGLDINVVDKHGETPLDRVVLGKNKGLLEGDKEKLALVTLMENCGAKRSNERRVGGSNEKSIEVVTSRSKRSRETEETEQQ